ncbi:hypothetical protein LCGC14_0624080 [marine sediment metagenome]|uniref:Uncharacterized protein n=1 Tax=marine sediment metagenome TaxID=412755 RepID=A0A0F9R428_9ZZZZ
MPKGIGYQDASKLSAFRRKKSKDKESLKKPKFNKRTESVIRGLVKAGFTREEAEARVDKSAREAAKKRSR